jgi:hypothetical protein
MPSSSPLTLVLFGLCAAVSLPASRSSAADPAAKPVAAPNDFNRRIGQAVVGGGFAMDGYWVWGSSVVKGDDGLFHMFVSRWPKRLPFHPGWMVASEIVHATSKTAEGPYQFSEAALPARGAQYWDGRSTHNPKINKVVGKRGETTYVLFYMGSTHPFDEPKPEALTLDSPYTTLARANKRIGVATASSPFGPWKRSDAPVLDTKPGTYYSFLTTNPAPLIEKDGRTLLLFKARAYGDKFPYQSPMTIGVARAPHYLGPYKVVTDKPIFGVDQGGEVEDPYIWKEKGKPGFHLVAKDQRGGITGEKHAGFLAHSPDGQHWTVDPAPLAYSRKMTWTDGKVQVMGQLERPFILFQDGVATHMFFATMDGPGGFQNGTRSWNMVVRLQPPR